MRPTADAKIKLRLWHIECLVRGLKQVASGHLNLLSTPLSSLAGGSVRVTLSCVEPTALLTVSDSGEGISSEFLPYVFDRFRQAEGSISRRQGGLGLGLAVVRHLAELHGGRVRAESGGLGCGSTFRVELPLAKERRDPERAEERRREIERRRSAGRAVVELEGLRVLLVEDDDDSRRFLSTMLKRHGAEVTSAKSAAEAFSVFDAQFLDVHTSSENASDIGGRFA